MRVPARMQAALLRAVSARTVDIRPPDVTIGDSNPPYMRRWFVIPRNRWFNIYFHNLMRSDDDRALHDHPWINLSILLRGTYIEHVPRDRDDPGGPTWGIVRHEGSIVFRRSARMAHRLALLQDHWFLVPDGEEPREHDVWTLFITGPKMRTWGFWCPNRRWIPWQKFTTPIGNNKSGGIGAGCGEDA